MFWLSLTLLVASVAALLAYAFQGSGPPEPFTRRALAMLVVFSAAVAVGAVWLFRAEEIVWGSLVLLLGFGLLFAEVADWVFPRLRRRFLAFWLPLILSLSLASWAVQEWVTPRDNEASRPETRAPGPTIADLLARTRTRWEPADGVAEGTAGPLIGWLAVAPMIAVDWAHEQDRHAAVRRSIPLRVVLLNNSFAELPVAAEPSDAALWRLAIIATASGATVRAWNAPEDAARRAFSPTERRDFRVLWDGRDQAGNLAPPGSYVAHLILASENAAASALEIDVAFAIEDAGPIVVVKEDPQTTIMRQMEQNLRASQILDAGLREMERQRQFQFQFLRRFP